MDALLLFSYVLVFALGYWLRSYISWRRRWGRS